MGNSFFFNEYSSSYGWFFVFGFPMIRVTFPTFRIVFTRVALFVVLLAGLILLAVLFSMSGIQSNIMLHVNISLISALLSAFAGALSLVRYFANPACPYLLIGIAFTGNAILEAFYSYVLGFYGNLYLDNSLPSFILWSWTFTRLFTSVFMVLAWFECYKTRFEIKTSKVILLAILLIAAISFLLIKVNLPPIQGGHRITRPVDFIPGFFFLVALIGFLLKDLWKQSAFFYFLVLSLLIKTGTHFLLTPYSSLFDERFLLANHLRILSHSLIIIGLLLEISKSFKDSEEKSQKLERARKRVLETAEKYLAVIQTANDVVISADSSGKIVAVNKSVKIIFGYEDTELLGRSVSEIIPGIYDFIHDNGKLRNQQTDPTLRKKTLESEALSKNWNRFPVELSISNWEFDEKIYMTIIVRDITERIEADMAMKKLNRQLEERNTELENYTKELEQYAYIASHDLKEPLRSIAGFSDLLVKNCVCTAEATEYSKLIQNGVKRMKSIIDDLLIYTQIKKDTSNTKVLPVNLVLEKVIKSLEHEIRSTGAHIDFSNLPDVLACEHHVTTVFYHLLSNSLKFARENVPPVIKIKAVKTGRKILFSVEDNGIGIDEAYREKVFTMFQRLHGRAEYEGTGIGLAICKKIVEMYNGKIWLESDLDKGTTFFFSLPAAKQRN